MGINRTNYVQYETYETWILYQEFHNIPENLLKINPTSGMVLSTEMMHNILNTAYRFTERNDTTSLTK